MGKKDSKTKAFEVVTGGTYPIDQIVTVAAHAMYDTLKEGPVGMLIQMEVARRAGVEVGAGLNSDEERAAWGKAFGEVALAALGLSAAIVAAQMGLTDEEATLNVSKLQEVGLDVMISGQEGPCPDDCGGDHHSHNVDKAKVEIVQHGDVVVRHDDIPQASTGGVGGYL